MFNWIITGLGAHRRGLTFITARSKEQSYSRSKEKADCLILTSYNSLRTWNTSFHSAVAALANSKGPDVSISEKPGKAGRYHLKSTETVPGMGFSAGLGCERAGFAQSLGSPAQTLLYSLTERSIHTPGICPAGTRDPKLKLNKNFMQPLRCWQYFPMHISKNIWSVQAAYLKPFWFLGRFLKPHSF